MLNTENASALIGGANQNAGKSHEVEVLIATFVQSLGRDVQVGEVVEISNADYRFLKPYNYVKDVEAEAPVNAGTDNDKDNDKDKDKAPKGNLPKGNRS
jgi:hypothetical protein